MNGQELECAVRSNQCIVQSFQGVYSRNNLPSTSVPYPSIFIVNTDSVNGPGEHWVAIVLESKSSGIFFDSFGKSPIYYGQELAAFMNNNVIAYKHFTNTVQSSTSSRCGLFVLTFLILNVCFRCNLNCILDFFDSDVYINDRIVFNFVNMYYDLCK